MPKLKVPVKLHNNNGWRSKPDHEAHVELDMRFNGPTPDGPVVEEWVFAEHTTRNYFYDCFDWVWNWNKRRRQRETEKTKRICSNMCARMDSKIEDAQDRIAVMDQLVREKVRLKDKAGAKQVLIGKKRLVKQLAAYEAYKRDLDTLAESLEQSEDQKEFIKEMKSANKVLKKQKMGKAIDSVETMLDDLDDHRQDMEEFHNTLTMRNAGQDDELEEELADLFGEKPIVIPKTAITADRDRELINNMPLPPTHKAAVETLQELDEITSASTI